MKRTFDMTNNNTGNCNTGNWNTGSRNTGYRNTGNCNTGHWNTGSHNTGKRNTDNCNTGHWNTGSRNTGNWNTGNWNTGSHSTGNWNTDNWNTGSHNTGSYNTGSWNTGHWNTGSWNTADNHTGCFNTIDPEKAYYFNTLIDKSEWSRAQKPDWLYEPSPTTWVHTIEMTPIEKEAFPSYKTTEGYLRVNDLKEEWRKAYESATEEEVQMVRDLPGFDYEVFEEITGLDIRLDTKEDCSGKTVMVDGVEYVLNRKEDF